MQYSNIRVLVARSLSAVDASQCDDVRDCDTIREAKEFARYALTESYQQSCEMSEPMNYSRVMAVEEGRDVCVADFFRKGYIEPVNPREVYDEAADDSEVTAGNLAGDDDARHLGDEHPCNWNPA